MAKTGITGRLARLRQKNWAELRFRARQEMQNRWDGLLYRVGRTSPMDGRRLVASAPPGATPAFFFSSADVPQLVEILRARLPESVEETIAQAEMACEQRFDLLGYTGLDYGPKIDWHLDRVHNKRAPWKLWYRIPYLDFNTVGDVKITWELNRHQHCVALGKAYRFNGAEKYALEFVQQFADWQRENPYPLGVNWASSLEVAFRSLSWLWARELFAGAASLSSRFREDMLAALGRNARFIERNLSTYFSANTHLLGEAVALFFIGTLCPELGAAQHWQALGWKIVLAEAERQVRRDGGYFEQSTYYHVYALDFLMHARILASRNQLPISEALDRTILRMLEYLAALGTAGPPPRFGDDDGGRVFNPRRNRAEHLLDPLSTGAVLFRRADFKAAGKTLQEETLWLLGPSAADEFDRLPETSPPAVSRAFPETGTYVLASPGLRLAIDAGPLGVSRGGHGHADALSVNAAAGGSEWLGDPGTFTYTGSRKRRDAFRGTRAHNTLTVDGVDQAEAIEPFAWARLPESRVERWLPGETFDLLVASHDGYLRMASPVRHRRLVFFVKDRFWLVVDTAEGHGEHQLQLFWHLTRQHGLEAGAVSSAAGSAGSHEGFTVVPLQDAAWDVSLEETFWSPNYGAEERAQALCCSAKLNLPAEFATLLVPCGQAFGETGTLEPLRGSEGVRGYRYASEGERHCWVLSETRAQWHVEGLESDALVAYCAWDAGGRIRHIVLCDGTYLALQGQKLLEAAPPAAAVARIEYRWSEGCGEVFRSEGAKAVALDARNAEMASVGAGKKETIDCT